MCRLLLNGFMQQAGALRRPAFTGLTEQCCAVAYVVVGWAAMAVCVCVCVKESLLPQILNGLFCVATSCFRPLRNFNLAIVAKRRINSRLGVSVCLCVKKEGKRMWCVCTGGWGPSVTISNSSPNQKLRKQLTGFKGENTNGWIMWLQLFSDLHGDINYLETHRII